MTAAMTETAPCGRTMYCSVVGRHQDHCEKCLVLEGAYLSAYVSDALWAVLFDERGEDVPTGTLPRWAHPAHEQWVQACDTWQREQGDLLLEVMRRRRLRPEWRRPHPRVDAGSDHPWRWLRQRRTYCVHGHEYTPENTYVRPNGWRECRTCIRDRQHWASRTELAS